MTSSARSCIQAFEPGRAVQGVAVVGVEDLDPSLQPLAPASRPSAISLIWACRLATSCWPQR